MEQLMREASSIMLESGLGYDSIHAAASIHAAVMKRAGLNTVITKDVENWKNQNYPSDEYAKSL